MLALVTKKTAAFIIFFDYCTRTHQLYSSILHQLRSQQFLALSEPVGLVSYPGTISRLHTRHTLNRVARICGRVCARIYPPHKFHHIPSLRPFFTVYTYLVTRLYFNRGWDRGFPPFPPNGMPSILFDRRQNTTRARRVSCRRGRSLTAIVSIANFSRV